MDAIPEQFNVAMYFVDRNVHEGRGERGSRAPGRRVGVATRVRSCCVRCHAEKNGYNHETRPVCRRHEERPPRQAAHTGLHADSASMAMPEKPPDAEAD